MPAEHGDTHTHHTYTLLSGAFSKKRCHLGAEDRRFQPAVGTCAVRESRDTDSR
jgi:hypothetical protein